MLAGAPPQMLDRWMAYYRLEPFGQARGDMQAAIVANMLSRVNGGDADPVHEFILKFKPLGPDGPDEDDTDPTARWQDPDEIDAKLRLWAHVNNQQSSSGTP